MRNSPIVPHRLPGNQTACIFWTIGLDHSRTARSRLTSTTFHACRLTRLPSQPTTRPSKCPLRFQQRLEDQLQEVKCLRIRTRGECNPAPQSLCRTHIRFASRLATYPSLRRTSPSPYQRYILTSRLEQTTTRLKRFALCIGHIVLLSLIAYASARRSSFSDCTHLSTEL